MIFLGRTIALLSLMAWIMVPAAATMYFKNEKKEILVFPLVFGVSFIALPYFIVFNDNRFLIFPGIGFVVAFFFP